MADSVLSGLLAQLVARSLDMGEVTGSSPVETTRLRLTGFVWLAALWLSKITFVQNMSDY
jgi:hypothetical protein